MIHHIMLSGGNVDDPNRFTEPSERMLKVEVIAGVAHLSIYNSRDLDPADAPDEGVRPEATIEVAAESLVRAVVVQLEDARGGLPAGWEPPGQPPADPAHRHTSWSPVERERRA